MNKKKLILIVLDSVGAGELPDSDAYGDRGTNTISNIAQAVGGLNLPNLASLGLGNITDIKGVPRAINASGCYGKMVEVSAGKDSTIGHWEIAGIITKKMFPVYPNGFPLDLLEKFLLQTGCGGYLGNKPASGTDIIFELGDEHIRTGFPIVYTSGDSVFQIAAHEDVISLKRLYEICEIAREHVLIDEHSVGRVIARPFTGKSGKYIRTPNRRDFSVKPPANTLLDLLVENNIRTIGIGKIDDLFSGRGLSEKVHTKSNAQTVEEIIKAGLAMETGLIMANLVDFDMLYGHRQDIKGYALAIEEFDRMLPDIQKCIGEGNLLMLTADHGNDPTDQSTDHTREYVPLLCSSISGKRNVNLGIRGSFADIAKTAVEYFGIADKQILAGQSFFCEIF